MSKSLINFFTADTLSAAMAINKKRIALDKTVSFRPPDQEFCDAMNIALDATGASPQEICVAAIKEGLANAVAGMTEERRRAEALWKRRGMTPGGSGKK